uniref:thioredoxin O2, mitochondrial-like n=1 Tax=Erigeron canadensis TaxID=72917 RepID=UPI001CB8A09B|nr:thioredoxin O2, mitochondrial-like [Erigeron canadensis]
MRGVFAGRRMLRNGVYCGSLFSSLHEFPATTSSAPNPAALIYPTSFFPKPSSTPIFRSHPFNPNHYSTSSSPHQMIITGKSRVISVESEDQFNSLLRKVQDESLPAIFYFTAVWCGPCRFISPLIGELSEKYTKVTTYKIDIDQEGLRGALEKLNIAAVPTLHFFQGGKKVSEIVGADIQKLKTTMEDLYK